VDVSPTHSGSVQINQVIPFSYPSIFVFSDGESVRLEAIPASGYRFESWGGNLSGTLNPLIFSINSDKNITVNFSRMTHTLTIQSSGNGATTPKAGSYDYGENSSIRIIAVPDSGWQFDSWIGDVVDAASTETLVNMDSDKDITARFLPVQHTLTIQIVGGGSTAPQMGAYVYDEGQIVSVKAIPDKGWQFDGWTGDVVNSGSTSSSVTINTSKTISANFSPTKHNWPLIYGTVLGLLILGTIIWAIIRRRII
jgi:hypothetical protein